MKSCDKNIRNHLRHVFNCNPLKSSGILWNFYNSNRFRPPSSCITWQLVPSCWKHNAFTDWAALVALHPPSRKQKHVTFQNEHNCWSLLQRKPDWLSTYSQLHFLNAMRLMCIHLDNRRIRKWWISVVQPSRDKTGAVLLTFLLMSVNWENMSDQ